MNGCCAGALRDKEVINVCDGSRLGYICDFAVDTCSGRLISISVPGNRSLFGGGRGLVIPWCKIDRIGDDIILVNIKPEECCPPPKKPNNKKSVWDRIRCFLEC